MEELLESSDWNQFVETRAGIRVLDKLLALRSDVASQILEAEDARRYDAGEYDS